MNKILKILVVMSLLAFVATPIFAATPTAKTKDLSTAITAATKDIDAKISQINKVINTINGFKRLTTVQKTAIVTNLQGLIKGLNDLKAKIAADKDIASVKKDDQSAKTSFRVQALVIPQVNVITAGNRALNVVDTFNGLLTKIKDRAKKLPTGTDLTQLQKLEADFSAKLTEAKTQAQTAIDKVSALKPDMGDKTIFASNKATIKAAKTNIKSAQTAIKDARKIATDMSKLIKSLSAKPEKTETTPTPEPTNP